MQGLYLGDSNPLPSCPPSLIGLRGDGVQSPGWMDGWRWRAEHAARSERSGDTHQAGAQAEDGGLPGLAVDVSAEEAVAHVGRVLPREVGAVAARLSQVHHRICGRDEVGVRAQVEVEALAERVDPVVNP